MGTRRARTIIFAAAISAILVAAPPGALVAARDAASGEPGVGASPRPVACGHALTMSPRVPTAPVVVAWEGVSGRRWI
jgi:hypothetical protein